MLLNFIPKRFLFFILLLALLPLCSIGQVSYNNAFPNIDFRVPVEIQHAADGSNRLFVVEQQGVIKVFPNNNQVTVNQVATFLDISSKVRYSSGQELGLLGLAFHPDFSTNRYIYVYYTDRTTTHRINIVRYQTSISDPNLVDLNSETIIAQFTKNQTESNHNGGKIAFGPDGYLYISIGDGGGGGDPQGNAQNLNTVFGSILRLDIDINGDNPIESNPELPNGNYEIPSDNPRVGESGLDEIYAWGIRNTWKMSFDNTGKLWGADVGQNAREEINIITNGGNFGWNRLEGNSDYRPNTTLVTNPDIKPIFTYGHNAGDKSITGGYVYRGSLTSASLQNKYIYGDYLTGRVWALTYTTTGDANSELLFRASGESISSFGEDEAGELYFLGYGSNGKIFKLTETGTGPVTTRVNGVGEWKGINNGTNGRVETIVQESNNTRYIGGSFTSAGGITVSNLALITPDGQWQSFGSGSNGPVSSIAIGPNGHIFVGGNFTQIGGVSANNIAFWNGSAWSALGNGTTGPVLKLAFDKDGALYVGGVFSNAGNLRANNIARWENNVWTTLTDSNTGATGTNNEVRSLALDTDNNLYIGGNFDSAGGISTARIARWNGTNWSSLGDGTSGFVQAIAVVDNFIYAGGNFNLAGNRTANRIARWNLSSSTWETLGYGLSGSVNAISYNDNYIFVGGDFETASDTENNNKIVNNIARWSTAAGWEALGPNTEVGTNSSIETLEFSNNRNELFVGGNFSSVGEEQFNNIAIWAEEFCAEGSLVPEYQVNNVTGNGNSELTLTEGDSLVLGILSDTIDFTILLPNGQEVSGDYTMESVTTEQSGNYTFTTNTGCSEILGITVSENLNIDLDGDDVPDDEDACPNTPSNEPVDINGCSTSQLDDDNDGITNDDDTCSDTSSGESVNDEGCSELQIDSDADGVVDLLDECPTTPSDETADTNGCSPSQLDSDSDGVYDIDDLCPNTSVNERVDSNGCAPVSFPDGHFFITATANSCATDANGRFTIDATVENEYLVNLTTENQNMGSYEFTNTLEIPNLETANYTICITAPTSPQLESCFTVMIESTSSLEVLYTLDETGSGINLSLNGAKRYFITLNDRVFETEQKDINIELDKDTNELEIRSDLPCHGVYKQTITLKETFIAFPNPIQDNVTVDISELTDEQVAISIYSVTGQLLLHEEHLTNKETVILDTSSLSSGYFLLRLNGKSINKGFKLIK